MFNQTFPHKKKNSFKKHEFFAKPTKKKFSSAQLSKSSNSYEKEKLN
jgi:hypothetical protein